MNQWILLCLAAGLCVAGCTNGDKPLVQNDQVRTQDNLKTTHTKANQRVVFTTDKSLALGISLPKTKFVTGETIPVLVRAFNLASNQPKTFSSPTADPFIVSVYQYTNDQWTEIKSYPQAGLVKQYDWTLRPGMVRRGKFQLPVEKDWPTYEPIRLGVRINGTDEPIAFVTIYIERPADK